MMFITLEGPDGSGKTTQVPRLADAIRRAGYEVVVTREPGGTEIGDQVRQVIMDLKNKSMFPESEILLFQQELLLMKEHQDTIRMARTFVSGRRAI